MQPARRGETSRAATARLHDSDAASTDALLDLARFDATALATDPYDHLVVPRFIRPDALAAINRDYPTLRGPGAHPIETVGRDGAFAEFWNVVNGPVLRARIAAKFDLELNEAATMATVRGECEQADGAIHTDSRTKTITVLFYFNATWPHAGGRLRLLRSSTDIDDYAHEVIPEAGAMLVFRRCDWSYHGHLPFVGPRRTMQMHYVDAKRIVRNERKRRTVKWRIKKTFGLG